ncbi:hypothetical protein Bbelb_444350 [Branchiostoma belcheri]|nr:hypothetical protein Bbelb_444350 [Branchiostoma belcheri]
MSHASAQARRINERRRCHTGACPEACRRDDRFRLVARGLLGVPKVRRLKSCSTTTMQLKSCQKCLFFSCRQDPSPDARLFPYGQLLGYWTSMLEGKSLLSQPRVLWFWHTDDFRVDCELCRHWGLSRRTGAKQNCAGGVEERRGRSRFFAGAKQNGAGAKQNGGGEEEGVSWGWCYEQESKEN